jgi:hypothetical protein
MQMSFWDNFLKRGTPQNKKKIPNLAIKAKYLLSNIDDETLKKRKSEMLEALVFEGYMITTGSWIRIHKDPLDSNIIQFHQSHLTRDFLSITFSDKVNSWLEDRPAHTFAHFRKLSSIRDDIPLEITVRFYPENDQNTIGKINVIVEILVYPAIILKIRQHLKDYEKIDELNLSFLADSSIEEAKNIGASVKGIEIQPPMISDQPPLNLGPIFPTNENIDESYPIEIQESLKTFRTDFPDPKKVSFIMMQFGDTEEYTNILISVRKTLVENGLSGVRADDKAYHDDKLYNILTYLHGCGSGVAVFETITDQSFNPNVSLEAGYLMGLHKPICLLKEKSLETLPSDLVGRLYQEFNIEQCDISISNVLKNWLDDKGLSIISNKSENS